MPSFNPRGRTRTVDSNPPTNLLVVPISRQRRGRLGLRWSIYVVQEECAQGAPRAVRVRSDPMQFTALRCIVYLQDFNCDGWLYDRSILHRNYPKQRTSAVGPGSERTGRRGSIHTLDCLEAARSRVPTHDYPERISEIICVPHIYFCLLEIYACVCVYGK